MTSVVVRSAVMIASVVVAPAALAQSVPMGIGGSGGGNSAAMPTMGSAPTPASAPSSSSPSSLSATKKADPGFLGGKWYGSVELRHHLNTYYGDGSESRQEPTLHARIQMGARFYDGMVDAYGTLGVFKQPHTEQVMQRRPELALDLYPVRTEHWQILQYNLLQLPVKRDDSGIAQEASDDEKDDYSDSTVYLIGLAPLAKFPFMAGSTKVELKAGLDGWTKQYSRRQYTQVNPPTDPGDETDQGRLSLTTSPGDPGAIEDYAPHYQGEAMTGFSLTPMSLPGVSAETTVHYHSRFDPRYVQNPGGDVGYSYGVERYSYLRVRLHYDVTDRVSVTDDFYDFREGFFQAYRPATEWRYRNIARLTCKL